MFIGPKLRTYGSSVDIEGVVISAEICVSAMHFFWIGRSKSKGLSSHPQARKHTARLRGTTATPQNQATLRGTWPRRRAQCQHQHWLVCCKGGSSCQMVCWQLAEQICLKSLGDLGSGAGRLNEPWTDVWQDRCSCVFLVAPTKRELWKLCCKILIYQCRRQLGMQLFDTCGQELYNPLLQLLLQDQCRLTVKLLVLRLLQAPFPERDLSKRMKSNCQRSCKGIKRPMWASPRPAFWTSLSARMLNLRHANMHMTIWRKNM